MHFGPLPARWLQSASFSKRPAQELSCLAARSLRSDFKRASSPARPRCRILRQSKSRYPSILRAPLAIICATGASAAAGATVLLPAVAGIPIDFFLFALTLIGVALFHRHTSRLR
jgi:hypothetical protein